MPSSKIKGFTLIEVLLAAVILFMFLTMASMAFNQAANASLKAERAAKVAAIVPLLTQNIKEVILRSRGTSESGQGQFGQMAFRWKASLKQRKAPPPRFDPAELEFKHYPERFNLWLVDLVVIIGSYERHWQYEELSWYE